MRKYVANSNRGHMGATGSETIREWTGPGGVAVIAIRGDNGWRIDAGPANLVGRTFRHIRDARIAVRQHRL